MKEKLYKKISGLLSAIENCRKSDNLEWLEKHYSRVKKLVTNEIPFHTRLDLEESTPEKLVFYFSYHHMNDMGYYIGWQDYKVIVKPSLQFGLNIRIIGKDKNNIKDYFYDVFFIALNEAIEDKDYTSLESEEKING